jgi:hypothetical protein
MQIGFLAETSKRQKASGILLPLSSVGAVYDRAYRGKEPTGIKLAQTDQGYD